LRIGRAVLTNRRQTRRMSVMSTVVGIVFVAGTSHSLPLFARELPGTALGTVTAVNGEVHRVRAGKQTVVNLGLAVRINDEFRTDAKSGVTITMRGGSSIQLSESTDFIVDQYAIGEDRLVSARFRLARGRVRALVNEKFASANGSGFEVMTPNAVAAVRGTEFAIWHVIGKPCPGFLSCLEYTDVNVFAGTVELSNPTNPTASTVRVGAGYASAVPCSLPPTRPQPISSPTTIQSNGRPASS